MIDQQLASMQIKPELAALLKNDDFCRRLDELSVEVQDLGAQFASDHMHLIGPLVRGGKVDPEDIIELVVGWILGFRSAQATDERRHAVLLQSIVTAAHAAGTCATLCRPAARRQFS